MTILECADEGFKAREAWRKHKAWGVSPRRLAFEFPAREVGGSGYKKASVMKNHARQGSQSAVARSARWLNLIRSLTWGSAALHPRLYAFTRYRGLLSGSVLDQEYD